MDKRFSTGFSLIEMMVTVFIIGIVLAIGIPSVGTFMDNSRMAASTNDLMTGLHAARAEAIKRNQNTTICPSDDGVTCAAAGDFSIGWIGFVDCTVAPPNPCVPNGTVDGVDVNEIFISRRQLPDAITFLSSDAAGNPAPRLISFNANGTVATNIGALVMVSDMQLCDNRGDMDTGAGIAAGRWINISPTGRPRIYRDQNAVQSAANPLPGC